MLNIKYDSKCQVEMINLFFIILLTPIEMDLFFHYVCHMKQLCSILSRFRYCFENLFDQ